MAKTQTTLDVKLLVWMVVYVGLFAVALELIEPRKQPPGFTGRGFGAVIIILLGAFHGGKYQGPLWAFQLYGSLGALLLLRPYLYGPSFEAHRQSMDGNLPLAIEWVAWVIFTAGIGALARYLAVFRRRLARTRDPKRCSKCGYDLRATPDRCPECGTVQISDAS